MARFGRSTSFDMASHPGTRLPRPMVISNATKAKETKSNSITFSAELVSRSVDLPSSVDGNFEGIGTDRNYIERTAGKRSVMVCL